MCYKKPIYLLLASQVNVTVTLCLDLCINFFSFMGRVVRKSVLRVSGQDQHKPGHNATEYG